jgi:hypothetical protein
MRNFFTRQDVPSELIGLTMTDTVTIDDSYPGYFSYRILLDASYNPYGPNALEDITVEHFTKIAADPSGYVGNWDVLQAEVTFLDQIGLIVEKEGARYVSPLALVFYGSTGLFVKDFELEMSTLSTPDDRLNFLTPVLNLFAQFVLPGRIMRLNMMRGELPDSVHYGHALNEEIAEMDGVLKFIRDLL